MRVEDEQLMEWNRRGLIPGPEEPDDQYVQRANHCLNLKHELKLDPDFIVKQSEEVIAPSLDTTRKFFDILPDWIPIVFGNRQLAPWHGGCAWIFQLSDPGPLGAFIQLRKAFLTYPVYLGLYSREEIVAHELAHAGRMAFQEPKFEEVLAYQSSKRWMTRVLGPLVESSTESMIFLLTLASVVFVEGVSVFYGQGLGGDIFLGLMSLPLAMVIYAVMRLWFKIRMFWKCKKKLTPLLNDPLKVNGVVYRLTDKEISRFSKWSPSEIEDYIKDQKGQTLRWRVIDLAYFSRS